MKNNNNIFLLISRFLKTSVYSGSMWIHYFLRPNTYHQHQATEQCYHTCSLSAMSPITEAPDSPKETLILSTSEPQRLNNSSLVLSALAITHRITVVGPDHFKIHVAKSLAERASQELSAYEKENALSPPIDIGNHFSPTFKAMSIIIAGCLTLLFSLTGSWHEQSSWFIAGAGDSTAILEQHQYFRLITALTLHADVVHLMGNCVIGTFLAHFFLHLTGNGIGLLAILFSSGLANLFNVLGRGPGHLFVGYSTAVFSIVGMLCTINYHGRQKSHKLRFFLPIMAGLAMLAFLGSSGQRTDLGAHFYGLLCGLLLGNFVRLPQYLTLRKSFLFQTLLVTLGLAIPILAWCLAFS